MLFTYLSKNATANPRMSMVPALAIPTVHIVFNILVFVLTLNLLSILLSMRILTLSTLLFTRIILDLTLQSLLWG